MLQKTRSGIRSFNTLKKMNGIYEEWNLKQKQPTPACLRYGLSINCRGNDHFLRQLSGYLYQFVRHLFATGTALGAAKTFERWNAGNPSKTLSRQSKYRVNSKV
jgi:hypothetical protein